jgi:hypothetical protein
MNSLKRALAGMALIVAAVSTPFTSGPSQPAEATPIGPHDERDRGALDVGTSLIVLCFPGVGCIVCSNGYCEYTKRV